MAGAGVVPRVGALEGDIPEPLEYLDAPVGLELLDECAKGGAHDAATNERDVDGFAWYSHAFSLRWGICSTPVSAVTAVLKADLFKLAVDPAYFGIVLMFECRGLDPAADTPERLRSLSRAAECVDCDEPGRGKSASQPPEVDTDPTVDLCGGSIAGKVSVGSTGVKHNVRLRRNYYTRFVDGGRAVGNRQRTRQSARL